MESMQQSTKPSPPPYTLEVDDAPHNFLDRIINFADHQREGLESMTASHEVDRVRRLLSFSMSIDYQCNNQALLSAPDRDHFTTMANILSTLKQASQNTPILASERQQLAAYFWKYLHEPCKALDICPESVALCITRMLKYSNCYKGSYQGCCFNILQDHGLDALAIKLYLDQRILIPRIFEDLHTRHRMHSAPSEFRELYFSRIYGIEASTEAGFVSARDWAFLQTVTYDAIERGKQFERLRNFCTVAASAQFSAKHWVDKVSRCVESLKRRSKLGQDAKPRPRWGYPAGWWLFDDDVTLPNFIEERRLASGTLL